MAWKWLFLWLMLSSIQTYSQNLIPNSGFEKNIEGRVSDWLQPLHDYYHYETYSANVNGKVSFKSYNGLCLIYPQASEYFVVKLNEKLISGQTYCAQMDIMISGVDGNQFKSLAKIEWKFMETAPIVSTREKLFETPDINFPLYSEDVDAGFKTKSEEYFANGDEEYLVIGKFFNKVIDSTYFAVYNKRVLLNRKYETDVRMVNDTFLPLYPPIPDYTKKSYKNKETETYNRLVTDLDDEKAEVMKALKMEYIDNMQTLDLPHSVVSFNVRTYFDNICLSETQKDEVCNCNNEEELPMVSGNTYRLNAVNFETGKYKLDATAMEELDNVVTLLKEYPSTHIQLSGHTDNINTPAANLLLSQQRAETCYNYLVSKGIDANRLSWKGHGAEKPLTNNNTEEGRRMNRRVEFLVK